MAGTFRRPLHTVVFVVLFPKLGQVLSSSQRNYWKVIIIRGITREAGGLSVKQTQAAAGLPGLAFRDPTPPDLQITTPSWRRLLAASRSFESQQAPGANFLLFPVRETFDL